MKKLLFSVAAVTLLFASCKKDDDNNANVNRKDVLTSGKWKVTAMTMTASVAGVNQTQDLMSLMDECEKDDLFIFKTDMHVIQDAGTVKCSSSQNQQEDQGTWALTDNDTKLSSDAVSAGNAQSSNIDQLDNSTMVLSQSTSQGAGGVTATTTYKVTFTHVN